MQLIRATYITLEDIGGRCYHVFSVFEEMYPDMQDAEDAGKRAFLPDDALATENKAGKQNLTFHTTVLPQGTLWRDVVKNPRIFLKVKGNPVEWMDGTDMEAVDCTVPAFLNFQIHPDSTLLAVLPYRTCGALVSRYCDKDQTTWDMISADNRLSKQLRYLTKKFYGYDLTQYPEHVGNVHLVRWNKLFKDMDCLCEEATGKLLLHFHYHDIIPPAIIVYVSGRNKSGNLLYDYEALHVHAEKYAEIQLPEIPARLALRFYDESGKLWYEAPRVGKIAQIMVNAMMIGPKAEKKTKNNRGKERTIEVQKGERESMIIGKRYVKQDYLNEEIEHRRFIDDEQSLQFVFFDGDKDHKDRNERRATRIVRSILAKAQEKCFICDPYFDYYAFDKFIWPLTDVGVKIHIVNCDEFLDKEKALQDTIRKYHKEIGRQQVECHVLTGKGMLHDRFILQDGEGWLVGSSFNEFGNRATTITKIPKSAVVKLQKRVDEWINNSKVCRQLTL